jgi:hypothetical protein
LYVAGVIRDDQLFNSTARTAVSVLTSHYERIRDSLGHGLPSTTMASPRPSRARRQPRSRPTPGEARLEGMQHEIDHLRTLIAMLQDESAGHKRRCAELKQAIDDINKNERPDRSPFDPLTPPTVRAQARFELGTHSGAPLRRRRRHETTLKSLSDLPRP